MEELGSLIGGNMMLYAQILHIDCRAANDELDSMRTMVFEDWFVDDLGESERAWVVGHRRRKKRLVYWRRHGGV